MSAEAQKQAEREAIALQREIARNSDELKEDFNLRRNEELQKMQREIVEVIHAIAREDGYDLVLDAAAVVYASERVDLTDKVLKRLHEDARKGTEK